jgi:hypothetical protein
MKFRKFVTDFIESQTDPGFRRDAGDGINFARELENVRTTIYQVPIAEFKGRALVPVDHSVPAGAETDTYSWYDRVGKAEPITDYSKALPRVDIFGGQVTHGIKHFGLAYAWNIQQLRAAALAGKPLPAWVANAAREGCEATIDEGLLLGYSEFNMKGLFTLASTNTYTVPLGLAGSKTWALKTPREILADMHAMGRKVWVDSKEIETIDTLVLPSDQYALIAERQMGDGDNITVLRRFLNDSEWVKEVKSSTRLASNTGWTGARMVGYRKSPDVLQGIIPLEFTQQAPQMVGFEAITNCEIRVGGVQCYRPKAVIYGDEI